MSDRSGYEYPPEWQVTTGDVPILSEYPLIEVTWLDAACDTDNLPLGYEIKPLKRVTVGYLLHEYDYYLELTFGLIENLHKGIWACEMKTAIPKCMIISRRELA